MHRGRRSFRHIIVGVALIVAMSIGLVPVSRLLRTAGAAPPAGYVPNSALILGSTVTAGSAVAGTQLGGTDTRSLEQEQAEAAGFTVTVVDDTTWAAMTAADFAKYQLIIIGDPNCSSGPSYATALANAGVWEPVVMSSGGNKYLDGTDDETHHLGGGGGAQSTFVGGPGGAARVVKAGISFAGAVAGATGAYISLSCSAPSADGTALPLMDGLSSFGAGQFTQGPAPCAGTVSLVADFPGLAGAVSSADLSGWGCSAHEFIDKWPGDWVPLALATDPSVPQTFTATDKDTGATVTGSPYRLISGAGIVIHGCISLSPATATNPAGGSHTVTATLVSTSAGSCTTTPVSGTTVTFAISSGPNTGKTGTCTTDTNGQCSFTYTDTGGTGTDTIFASASVAGVSTSGSASKTWTTGGSPTTTTTSLKAGGTSGGTISVGPGTAVTDSATLSGSSAATAGGSVTYTVYSDNTCSTSVGSGGTKTVTAGGVPDSDPVTLNTPGTYYWQASYSGDSASGNNPSSSTCGDEVETVTATHTLTVTLAGTGTGSVSSSPSGIDCGSTCSATFNDGTSVTLTATPDAGSTFTGWSGDCTDTSSTCTVAMDADHAVTALFDRATTPPPPCEGDHHGRHDDCHHHAHVTIIVVFVFHSFCNHFFTWWDGLWGGSSGRGW